MSDKDKDLKIEFAPGALEELEADLSPEELQEFMDQLAKMVQDGSFFENSVEVNMDELMEQDPELYEKLINAEFNDQNKPTLH